MIGLGSRHCSGAIRRSGGLTRPGRYMPVLRTFGVNPHRPRGLSRDGRPTRIDPNTMLVLGLDMYIHTKQAQAPPRKFCVAKVGTRGCGHASYDSWPVHRTPFVSAGMRYEARLTL